MIGKSAIVVALCAVSCNAFSGQKMASFVPKSYTETALQMSGGDSQPELKVRIYIVESEFAI